MENKRTKPLGVRINKYQQNKSMMCSIGLHWLPFICIGHGSFQSIDYDFAIRWAPNKEHKTSNHYAINILVNSYLPVAFQFLTGVVGNRKTKLALNIRTVSDTKRASREQFSRAYYKYSGGKDWSEGIFGSILPYVGEQKKCNWKIKE